MKCRNYKVAKAMFKSAVVAMLAALLAFGQAIAGELPGVDLTPNESFISGSFTPEMKPMSVGGGSEYVLGAFRDAKRCDRVPDFEKLMTQQLERGMVIPDGVIFFNAGVTEYNSRSCKGVAKARVVGARIAPDFEGGIITFRFGDGKYTFRKELPPA